MYLQLATQWGWQGLGKVSPIPPVYAPQARITAVVNGCQLSSSRQAGRFGCGWRVDQIQEQSLNQWRHSWNRVGYKGYSGLAWNEHIAA